MTRRRVYWRDGPIALPENNPQKSITSSVLLTPIESSRALLRARLSEAASNPKVRLQRWFILDSAVEEVEKP